MTLREHLKTVERMMRRPEPRLHQECPFGMQHLWQWFQELHAARQPGPVGPAALSFTEIDAWSRLRRINVTPEEVSTLKRLDQVYLEVHYG